MIWNVFEINWVNLASKQLNRKNYTESGKKGNWLTRAEL